MGSEFNTAEHSDAVLETILKYSPERIATLRKAGII